MTTLPVYEVPQHFRDMAEKGVDQMRATFDLMFGAMKAASTSLAAAKPPLSPDFSEARAKALDYAHTNAQAMFDHMGRLVRARSFDEAVAEQTDFVKRQAQEMQKQAGDLLAPAADRQVSKPGAVAPVDLDASRPAA